MSALHLHEVEDLEFAPASEELNCLREAGDVCRSLGVAMAVGAFVVNVRAPFYCKATDAFAGNYLAVSRGFETRAEAEVFAAVECEDPDVWVEVLPPVPPVVPAVVAYAGPDEECPF